RCGLGIFIEVPFGRAWRRSGVSDRLGSRPGTVNGMRFNLVSTLWQEKNLYESHETTTTRYSRTCVTLALRRRRQVVERNPNARRTKVGRARAREEQVLKRGSVLAGHIESRHERPLQANARGGYLRVRTDCGGAPRLGPAVRAAGRGIAIGHPQRVT